MIFYRYYLEYSNSDTNTHIWLLKLVAVEETKKGYWVLSESDAKHYDVLKQNAPKSYTEKHLWRMKKSKAKWVPKKDNAKSQYAWDSQKKAIEHFINRTNSRINWYEYWWKECVKWVAIAEKAIKHGLLDEICIFDNHDDVW